MTNSFNDESQDAYAKIAEHLDCSLARVEAAFLHDGRHYSTLSTDVLRQRSAGHKAVLKFEAQLRKAIQQYRELPQDAAWAFHISGAPTIPQLEVLLYQASEQAQLMVDRHLANYPRAGGKDWEAHTIAFNLVTLFTDLDRDIGHWVKGEPETPFNKAVKFSLKCLGNSANWRRPAQAAAAYAKTIQK